MTGRTKHRSMWWFIPALGPKVLLEQVAKGPASYSHVFAVNVFRYQPFHDQTYAGKTVHHERHALSCSYDVSTGMLWPSTVPYLGLCLQCTLVLRLQKRWAL
jgi:hypothetical protein